MSSRLSVRTRLLLAFGLLAVLFLATGATSWWQFRAQIQAKAAADAGIDALIACQQEVEHVRLMAFRFLGTKRPEEMEAIERQLGSELPALVARAEAAGLKAARLDTLAASYAPVIALHKDFKTAKALQEIYQASQTAHDAAVEALTGALERRRAEEAMAQRERGRRLTTIIAISSAIAVVIALLSGYTIYRFLRGRITALSAAINATAAGDLSRTLARLGDDELARLGDGVRAMQEQLRGAVGSIRDESQQLGREAETLLGTAGAAAASGEENRTLSSSAAGEVGTVLKGFEAISSAVTEMQSSVGEIARNAGEVAARSQDVNRRTRDVGASIQRLNEVFTKVETNVGAIEGINQQINLLALNATIEAARAGDAGRGFAVVANEVKLLSVRTGDANKQIAATIAELRGDLTATTQAVQEIVAGIEAISAAQATVAAAVEEQNATTSEIGRAVEQVVVAGSAARDHIAQVVASAAGAAGHADTTATAARSLRALAERLRAVVARFNVADPPTSAPPGAKESP
jgi:methyl-accepting chemotaxis protein